MNTDRRLVVGIKRGEEAHPLYHASMSPLEGYLPEPFFFFFVRIYYSIKRHSIKRLVRRTQVEFPEAWTVLVLEEAKAAEGNLVLEEAYASKKEAITRANYLSEQIVANAFDFIAAPKNLMRSGEKD